MVKPHSSNRVLNLEIGKRGWQPALDESQQLELLEVFVENDWKLQPVRNWLDKTRGVELSERTLGRYKKKLHDRWKKINTGLDKPADWANNVALMKYGVPTEHLREMHRLWRDLMDMGTRVGLVPKRPTYRRLRWWGYVIRYYGDVIKENGDRQYVAEWYALRHMAAELFDRPIETEDLEQWLHYQPWEGGDKEAAYLQAIERELIPPINDKFTGKFLGDLTDEHHEQALQAMRVLQVRLLMLGHSKPYLLPSQVDFGEVIKGWEEEGQATLGSHRRYVGKEEEPNSQ